MAGRLLQPLVVAPSLPSGEEGLSRLQEAKQQFQAALSDGRPHLRNALRALTGLDTPQVPSKPIHVSHVLLL